MRVLLLGGSGLLSGAAASAFVLAGHDVTVVTRGQRALPSHGKLACLSADRADARALERALGDRRFEFTADFLAYDAGDVERLLGVAGFEPGRLVMISSGQVYLVTASPRPPFREGDADAPLMSEPSPGTRDHAEWAYGMGKRAAEAALARSATARGSSPLSLRLPVVQGEQDGRGSRRLWAWIERMLDGGPVLLPEGGRQVVRFVHADDVARCLLAFATAAEWPDVRALNLAQPDEMTLREFLLRVASLAGASPHWVDVDAAALELAGLAESCAPYWGRWCSRPDPSLALSLPGVRTRTVPEYLPAVVRAHLDGPRPKSHPGYARRKEEIDLAERLSGA